MGDEADDLATATATVAGFDNLQVFGPLEGAHVADGRALFDGDLGGGGFFCELSGIHWPEGAQAAPHVFLPPALHDGVALAVEPGGFCAGVFDEGVLAFLIVALANNDDIAALYQCLQVGVDGFVVGLCAASNGVDFDAVAVFA